MSTNHMFILFLVSKYEISPKMIKTKILFFILLLIIYWKTSNKNNRIEILKERIRIMDHYSRKYSLEWYRIQTRSQTITVI